MLPSIWGKHDVARIDPVFVNGTLVTTLAQAPEGWEPRLEAIGFRRTRNGWARLGHLVQAEYQYLSSEIELVGFRPDFAIDIPAALSASETTPFEVRDEVLGFWQRKYSSLQASLYLEHGVTFSRGQVWTFVEQALESAITPESETVLGLAIESLRSKGALPADVQAMEARLKAWRGDTGKPYQAPIPRKIILAQSSAIKWTDTDGIARSGRLARPLRIGDTGILVYSDGPSWVGGYVSVAPIRVGRSSIFYDEPTPDWLPEHIQETANVSQPLTASPSPDRIDPSSVEVRQEVIASIAKLIQRNGYLTGNNGEWLTLARTQLGFDFPGDDSDQGIEWLNQVFSLLQQESKKVYGDDPIQFALSASADAGEPLTLSVVVAASINGNVYREGRSHSVPLWRSGQPIVPDFRGALQEVERQRSADETILRRSASALGAATEGGPTLPLRALLSCCTAMETIAEWNPEAIDQDYMYRLLSTQLRTAEIRDYIDRRSVDSSLSYTVYERAQRLLEFDVVNLKSSLIQLSDLVNLLSGQNELGIGWLKSLAKRELDSYVVRCDSSALDEKVPRAEGLMYTNVVKGGRPWLDWDSARLYQTLDPALNYYAEAIIRYSPALGGVEASRLEKHAELVKRYTLARRVREIPGRLRAISDESIKELIRADLYRLGGTRVMKIPEQNLDRILGQVAVAARREGVWGVTLELKARSIFTRPVNVDTAQMSETRAAVIGKAVSDIKDRGGRSIVIGLDTLSWIDPELVELLNGDDKPAVIKSSASVSNAGESADKYVDTGVVAGLAAKDIRGFDKAQLIASAELMSDSQKSNYITKELLWPRKSFEEMRELGALPRVAAMHDLIWKTVDAKPKSLMKSHVTAFIELVQAYKTLDRSLTGDLATYQDSLNAISSKLFGGDEFRHVSDVYCMRKDLKIRGTHTTLKSRVDFTQSSKLRDVAAHTDWSQLIRVKAKPKSVPAGSRVKRGELQRIGPDYRNGKSVTGEDFIRTFGFSGVEYGNWTTQEEREKHLNFAYDSMMDFARVLGWEPMALSLGGKLGLCIGSRGKGGRNAADAHFEPVNMAINLTRMRGDGTLAHEFFHAAANHFGRLYRGVSVDLADAIAYPLKSDENIRISAPETKGKLRQEVASSFYALMASIMRAPKDGATWADLSSYTEQSAFLRSAIAVDGEKKRVYWSQPAEMFARAGEAWFSNMLESAKQRNDYLVKQNYRESAMGLYPSDSHMQRINHYFSPWIDSIRNETQKVNHPYLGEIEMPVLNTEMYSRAPLVANDLISLAQEKLETLFKSAAPHLWVIDDPREKPGFYALARHLIQLNASCADEDTFNHEAWHAAHAVLLTEEEKGAMASIFVPESPLAKRLAHIMRVEGYADAVEHMLSDTKEMQAYAYQFWAAGKLNLSADSGLIEFNRANDFVEGVIEVKDVFGEAVVESLFNRFRSGELAQRRHEFDLHHETEISEADCWDADNIIWNLEPMQDNQMTRPRPFRLG
ncbi:hypothetical protein AX279_18195 [Pseudomonas sp. J237]|nr:MULTISPECIES: LPD1 domain-containing protein [Pseudomonas]OEO24597.1 hypothetical protein AX279_18195 [Pseudomonas sp. J237]